MNQKPESSDNEPRKQNQTLLEIVNTWFPYAWPFLPFLAALYFFFLTAETGIELFSFLPIGDDNVPCDGGYLSREVGIWGLAVVGLLYLLLASGKLKHRKERGFLGNLFFADSDEPHWLPFILFYTLPVIALIHFFDAKLMTGGFALADCPSCWKKQMLLPQGIDPFSIWENDQRFVFCHLEDDYCGKMDFLPFWEGWLGLYLVSASVLQWLRILAWKLRHNHPKVSRFVPKPLHTLEARALPIFSVVFLVITLATAYALRQQNGSTLDPPDTCNICADPAANCPPVKRAL